MKRSFLLILIASALFLSAGSPSPQPRPTPSPRPTESASPQIEQQNKPSENNHSIPAAAPTDLNQIHSIPSKTPTPDSNEEIQRELITLEGKIAAFTLLLVLVGALQFAAAPAQTCAAKKAGGAAVSSARAAELALRATRPFVLLDKLKMCNFEPRSRLTSSSILTVADITATNAGNGTAIITKIIARMKLTERPFPSRSNPPDFTDCQEMWAWWIKPNVIATKGNTNFKVRFEGNNLPDESYNKLKAHDNIALALYGMITYEDVFEGIYETTFGYLYSWGYSDTGEGSWGFQVVAPEYNRHREIKQKQNTGLSEPE
jgi:hypothetical protein